MRRSFIVAAAALALVGASSPAWAAKPAAPSYSITLDQAAPALGDVVTFTTTGAASLSNPRVALTCRQGITVVYGENGPVDAGFKLGGDSSPWLNGGGGAADCTARLADYRFKGGQWSITIYAETSFAAAG
jgi:hypothetical protein